ncbi:unnamed protein product [Caenorhabditis brenneri]
MIKFLLVIFYVILPKLHARDPLSSSTDSNYFEQNKLVIFLFFYGFFVLLAVTIFILRKYLKAKSNARSSAIQYTEVNGEEPCISISVAKNLVSPRDDLVVRLTKNEISYEEYQQKFEIDPTNLKVFKKRPLGEGHFGRVEQGALKKGTDILMVAVKRSHQPDDEKERRLFLAELTVMCALEKHSNLLCLVGGVTTSEPNQIVLELIDGFDLKKYMEESRRKFEDLKTWIEADSETRNSEKFANQQICLSSDLNELSTFDLISFAYQIANGMKYLASVPCVHRDLALRNVLVDRDGTVRIADFGLSRKYMNKDYYRPEGEDGDQPWLWMAPEAFEENRFNEKSDIFSYGICLYELFSLGEDPIIDNIRRPFWKTGRHKYLPLPDYSTARIYDLMKMCWKMDPSARPNFSWCLELVEGELKICSNNNKIFNDVEKRLDKVDQKHRELESWIANDQSFQK